MPMTHAHDSTDLAVRRLMERLGLENSPRFDPLWAAAPDFLGLIAEHALACRPGEIVECGSGVSTVVLARCCALNDHGHVYSLEHGAEYAQSTRAELDRHGVAAWATVIHAPLIEYPLVGRVYPWYALDGLPPTGIDMLVVDGPPAYKQTDARYPALPLLLSRCAGTVGIFLDDAARPGERAVVERWLAEQPRLRHEFHDTARGCSVLRQAGST